MEPSNIASHKNGIDSSHQLQSPLIEAMIPVMYIYSILVSVLFPRPTHHQQQQHLVQFPSSRIAIYTHHDKVSHNQKLVGRHAMRIECDEWADDCVTICWMHQCLWIRYALKSAVPKYSNDRTMLIHRQYIYIRKICAHFASIPLFLLWHRRLNSRCFGACHCCPCK